MLLRVDKGAAPPGGTFSFIVQALRFRGNCGRMFVASLISVTLQVVIINCNIYQILNVFHFFISIRTVI